MQQMYAQKCVYAQLSTCFSIPHTSVTPIHFTVVKTDEAFKVKVERNYRKKFKKGKKKEKILYIIETRNEGVKDCVQSAVWGQLKTSRQTTRVPSVDAVLKRDRGTNLRLKYLLILKNIFISCFFIFFFLNVFLPLTLESLKVKYNPLQAPTTHLNLHRQRYEGFI